MRKCGDSCLESNSFWHEDLETVKAPLEFKVRLSPGGRSRAGQIDKDQS